MDLLTKHHGHEASISRFIQVYGRKETFYMLFGLACASLDEYRHRHMNAIGTSEKHMMEFRKLCVNCMLKFGGSVGVANTNETIGNGGRNNVIFHHNDNWTHSDHFEGLLLFLSRMLRPMWKREIVKVRVTKD